VSIAAEAGENRVILIIEDDGPGLTNDQAIDAMRPGQRIDETTPGYGFGLPIARELAELHGGTLSLEKSKLGGLKVAIDLPRAR
jgi:signal transduction histidine kinase